MGALPLRYRSLNNPFVSEEPLMNELLEKHS
jgi:hypothetical protein